MTQEQELLQYRKNFRQIREKLGMDGIVKIFEQDLRKEDQRFHELIRDFDKVTLVTDEAKSSAQCDVEMTRGEMLRTGKFYMIAIAFACGLVAGVIIISNASPILQDALAFSTEKAALFVSIFSLCNMGGRFLWGSLSDKIGLYQAIAGVFIVCIAATACLAFSGTEMLIIIAMGITASCYGGLASMLTPLTGKTFGHRNLTSNFGCMYVVYGVAKENISKTDLKDAIGLSKYCIRNSHFDLYYLYSSTTFREMDSENRSILYDYGTYYFVYCVSYWTSHILICEMSLCRDLNKNRIVFLQKNSLCVILTKEFRGNEVLP